MSHYPTLYIEKLRHQKICGFTKVITIVRSTSSYCFFSILYKTRLHFQLKLSFPLVLQSFLQCCLYISLYLQIIHPMFRSTALKVRNRSNKINTNHSGTCLRTMYIVQNFIKRFFLCVLFLIAYKLLNMQYLNKHSWKNNSSLLLPSPVIRLLPNVTLKHDVKISEAQEQKLLQYSASSV